MKHKFNKSSYNSGELTAILLCDAIKKGDYPFTQGGTMARHLEESFRKDIDKLLNQEGEQDVFPCFGVNEIGIECKTFTIQDLRNRKQFGCSWLNFYKAHTPAERKRNVFVISSPMKKEKNGYILTEGLFMFGIDKSLLLPMELNPQHPAINVSDAARRSIAAQRRIFK